MKKAVLDSNEFIFALRDEKEFCVDVLKLTGIRFTALISHTIVEEVFLRLKELEGKDFASLIIHIIKNLKLEITDDSQIPLEIVEKYESRGAKKGDALIAAFTEWVGADYLITENRHFLKEIKIDKFKAINAENFIVVIGRR